MKKPRVLITYIESGMGHIMSMKAIADELKKDYIDQLNLIETYIMQDDNDDVKLKFEKFLTNQTKMTNKVRFYGSAIFFILESFGKQHFMRFIHQTIFKKATDATIAAMLANEPDVIISTHYFITYCAIVLKKKFLPNLTVITYNPDNNVHVWWDNRGDIFINNNETASKEAYKRRHFSQKALHSVFFTARNDLINANKTKEEYRKIYDINNNFTIIIADGAYASGQAKTVCNQLLKTTRNVNILFIAGKNEKMYNYFSKKALKVKKNINLKVLKFQSKIYELYAASDIFITKAGPNAILDCVFMKTPVIVDYYAHPIEKATANLFIDKLGCGKKVYRKRKILKEVEELIDHPELLEKYRQNIEKNLDKRNNGAKQIADIIVSELKKVGKL